MPTPERELQERARRLEGELLAAVRYQRPLRTAEIEAGAAAHSVEHLVFLEFRSGARFAVGYADELGLRHGFGITVRERRVIDPAYGPVVDVSATPQWAPRLGKAIRRADIHWDDIYERLRPSLGIGVAIHADHLGRADYPQTLELDMGEAGSAFLAAARVRPGGGRGVDAAVPFVNELAVFFSREHGEALGLR